MKPRDILVATHGHCFDGLASAALFTRLARALGGGGDRRPMSFRYKSCGYGPGMQQIPEAWLDGDESVILDFRYTPSKKLAWYFDHHITGFASTEERDSALAGAAARPEGRPQVFYDPTYGSCAKLVADVAAARFAVDMSDAATLISWADTIDAARFETAGAATDPDEPVLQLASVIEHHGDGPFLNTYAPRLAEGDVIEVARSAEIQKLWAPIRAARDAIEKRVKRSAAVRGPVVLVDLTDAPLEVAAKFVTYALYPQCTYSVMVTRNKQHFKISVGYNPWSGSPRAHDISAICKREGGGGHPAVGACSFPLNQGDRARETANAIAVELGG